MAHTTTNMGLVKWDELSDTFNHSDLANNWTAVDAHDHTAAKGVKIPFGGIAAGAVGADELKAGAVTGDKIAAGAIGADKIANISYDSLQTLASGNVLVGSASNKAAGVAMTGDVTISNTGATTIGTGAITPSKLAPGAVTAASGTRFPNYQVATLAAPAGTTDTSPGLSGKVWYSSIFIPATMTLTGISWLVGTIGGTNQVIVALYNNAGTVVANSNLSPGTTAGALATWQDVPFTGTYAAIGPARYFVSLSFNGTTPRFRSVDAAHHLLTGSATGAFGILASITPPTSFTTGLGPVLHTY